MLLFLVFSFFWLFVTNLSHTPCGRSYHNKEKKKSPCKQISNKFLYQIDLLDINYQIKLSDLKFTQSPYYIQKGKSSSKSAVNKQIRKSQSLDISIPILSEQSKPLIEKYFTNLEGSKKQFDQVNTTWRIIKYQQGGHFIAHCDRQKHLPDHKHFGTQLYLPPKSQFNYQGGEFEITFKENTQNILPDQKKWTHIILPLGVQHEVKKVTNGTRISFVKQIWVKSTDSSTQNKKHEQGIQQSESIQRNDEQFLVD